MRSRRSGGRYYGPLVDGKFHGRGKIEWSNGARYEGDFANGLYSGRGRMRFSTGDVYQGDYRNGAMEGQGQISWGVTVKSMWVNSATTDTTGRGRQTRDDRAV